MILPSLCTSCLLDPKWYPIWIATDADGKSIATSPTLEIKRVWNYVAYRLKADNIYLLKSCLTDPWINGFPISPAKY